MSSRSRLGRGWRRKTATAPRHARPVAQVPVELQSTDYGFPRVALPDSRPMIGRQVLAELAADEPLLPFEQELLATAVEPSPEAEAERAAYVRRLERSLAAVADDDTQPLDAVAFDEPPLPEQAGSAVPVRSAFQEALDGLFAPSVPVPAAVPVPVPSLPFLNAGAAVLRNGEQLDQDGEPTLLLAAPAGPPEGSALPAALTSFELELRPAAPVVLDTGVFEELLQAPTPAPAVGSVWPSARRELTPLPVPQQRDRDHRLVFAAFDTPFYLELARTVRDTQAAARELEVQGDAARDRLADRLAALEAAHQEFITVVAAEEYRGRLADSIHPLPTHLPPLPRRIPGAALTALQTHTPPQHDLAVAR